MRSFLARSVLRHVRLQHPGPPAVCAAYAAELEAASAQAAAKDLLERLGKGPVTLLYAARDERRNNAVALKAWLERPRRKNGRKS